MPANFLRIVTLVCAALLMNMPAWAGDEGLYDKAPPEGSSFFRFINTDQPDGQPKINGKGYDTAKLGDVKPYVVIPKGDVKLAFGTASANYTAVAKEYYTVVAQGGKLTVLKDPLPTDKLKAQVIFYNLTDLADVAVKTADGKVAAVGPVAAHASADRQINAVKVPFAIYAGENKVATLEPIALERGKSYAIVLTGTEAQPVTSFVKAEISSQ